MNVNELCKGNTVKFVKFKWDVFTYKISFGGRDMEFPVKREWVKQESLLPEQNADTEFWKKCIRIHLDSLY